LKQYKELFVKKGKGGNAKRSQRPFWVMAKNIFPPPWDNVAEQFDFSVINYNSDGGLESAQN
jgi:hypothetical protein